MQQTANSTFQEEQQPPPPPVALTVSLSPVFNIRAVHEDDGLVACPANLQMCRQARRKIESPHSAIIIFNSNSDCDRHRQHRQPTHNRHQVERSGCTDNTLQTHKLPTIDGRVRRERGNAWSLCVFYEDAVDLRILQHWQQRTLLTKPLHRHYRDRYYRGE